MAAIRLYLPAIVLFLWAATWAAGLTGDGLMALWLVALAVSIVVHIICSTERWRRGPR